nr:reverse transcriptase domain-containing protein [Tanacetum cinerariifolium]
MYLVEALIKNPAFLSPEHADDEIAAEDQPYAEDASPNAQSPEYVPESDLKAHPEDDDDEDPKEDPVDYPANEGDDGDDEEGLADKQSGRPSGSLHSIPQPNPKGISSKPYQPPQARNEHVNAVFTQSGKSYDPPDNPNDQQNNFEAPINFDSDDEDDEPTPQPKPKTPTPVKETSKPKSYKPNIPYP